MAPKKIFRPPPPKFPADTLPVPRPPPSSLSWKTPPRLAPGNFNKNRLSPLLAPLTPPSLPPSRKKSETSTKARNTLKNRITTMASAAFQVGACAMTTKCLDNKRHFQNFIVVAFPTKTSVFGRFSSLPPSPPPQKRAKILFLLSSRRL